MFDIYKAKEISPGVFAGRGAAMECDKDSLLQKIEKLNDSDFISFLCGCIDAYIESFKKDGGED